MKRKKNKPLIPWRLRMALSMMFVTNMLSGQMVTVIQPPRANPRPAPRNGGRGGSTKGHTHGRGGNKRVYSKK
jgi:hypothetical protein